MAINIGVTLFSPSQTCGSLLTVPSQVHPAGRTTRPRELRKTGVWDKSRFIGEARDTQSVTIAPCSRGRRLRTVAPRWVWVERHFARSNGYDSRRVVRLPLLPARGREGFEIKYKGLKYCLKIRDWWGSRLRLTVIPLGPVERLDSEGRCKHIQGVLLRQTSEAAYHTTNITEVWPRRMVEASP